MSDFAHGPSTIRIGDMEVSRLGFGAMQLPGPMVWGEPRDPDEARAVLRRAVELGVRLIDTSWYYGPLVSNRLIAEALHPYPADLVLATKLGGRREPDKGWASALSPEELQKGCDEDLRSLRLERVDVVHLRWIPHTDVPFREALDAMFAMQKAGKIRHVALSNVTLAQLEDALSRGPIVGVQNLYNVAAAEARLASLPHAVCQDQEAILELCTERKLAFVPFFSLAIPGFDAANAGLRSVAERHGRSVAEIALAWLLARSPAVLPIPGTSRLAHLETNWAARTIRLSADELQSITESR
jgi:pyridoxine 4-dehydrogenase